MTQPHSTISIIAPVLNEAERLGPLLNALASLDGDAEIIVVDGGSTDDTVKIAAAHPVTVVSSPEGRGNQLAAGRDAASGTVLWFVHADSAVATDSLSWIQDAVQRGAQFGCFSIYFHDSHTFSVRVIAYLSNVRARWFGWVYGDQGIFCLASFYDETGGFPRDLPLMEDLAFSQVAKKRAKPTVLEGRIGSSARRFVASGIWRTFWKMQCLKFAFLMGVSVDTLRKYY